MPGKEKLIMENLKYSGFEMIHRDDSFEDTHLKLLLNSYGHGISSVSRELHPEKSKKLTNSSELILKMDVVIMYICYCLNKESMIENEQIMKKLKILNKHSIQLVILIACSIMEGILFLIMEIAGAITSFSNLMYYF